MSLLKYIQTNPKPDGPLSTVVSSSSIVAEVKQIKQARGEKTRGHRHPSTEHMKPSLPKRRHRLETGRGVRCDSVSLPLLLPLIAEGKYHVYMYTSQSAFTACTGLLFVLLISWLWYMMGVTIYINVHACALCQWPQPCRLVRLFHEVFFAKSSFFANLRKFSPSKISRYTVPKQKQTFNFASNF